ncbi:hypothetical protein VNI00_003320 [Paramarasmius palmivorus]|uniref:Uncharacterized protein n=1 Tax=Paramarasmius palmivorus TaxID=297713 RepID=A0AAW0DVQ4_9AGAR
MDIFRSVVTRPSSFRSLRSLVFSGNRPFISNWFWDMINTAPKLTKVATTILHNSTVIPYHRLTILMITYTCECEDLLATLAHCTSLQVLGVCSLDADYDPEIEVNVASLRRLSFNTHGIDIHIFLEHLTLPRLETLEIAVWSDDESGSVSLEPFADLLRRSECPLNELSLDIPYFYTSDAGLRALFELCPGISRLELSVWEEKKDRDTFIYGLLNALRPSPDKSKGMLAPRLAEIRVVEDNSSVDQATATALLDIIEARNGRRIDESIDIWDFKLEFGELQECPVEVLMAFNARMNGLVDKGVQCTIEWAKGTFSEC